MKRGPANGKQLTSARLHCLSAAYGLALAAGAAPAHAQVSARVSVDQHGDFVLFGNTLAQNCAPGVDAPLVGSVGACGDDSGDSGADVFWSTEGAVAVANTSVVLEEAASVAVLELPAGAVVTHARLYWSALSGGGETDVATLARPGGFSEAVPASVTSVLVAGGDEFYQSSADVTELVRAQGEGAYRVSGVDAADIVDLDSSVHYAGWWMVVFYELSSEPLRNLTLFDGFELVSEDNDQGVTLSGFDVPAGGFDAKLGVVAYEGDAANAGDELRFGPAAPLGAGDALLNSDNFFDASRRGVTGAAVSVPGDLPQLSGEANSMSGLDLDVVDVTERMTPGQTSAAISALTDIDLYLLAGFVTSITTFLPDLTASVKSVSDVNGPPLRPGDELEYTVTVSNVGTDAAVEVLLLDPLPATVSFVPGTLAIASGPNAGVLTDGADADPGELDASGAGQTLVVRLGEGADGALGGRLDVGESSSIIYRVSVNAGAAGNIENQAEISALGELGGEASVTPTDGNLAAPGAPPTGIAIDACSVDSDCAGAAAHCDVEDSPQSCVECLVDAHCPGERPTCSAGRVCSCVGSNAGTGAETSCDGRDDNCDGQIDEGFVGLACSFGVGACAVGGVTACATLTTTRCVATAGAPGVEACQGGSDEDCDGLIDLADPDCADSDADGVADGVELAIGTNPADADSDDDGVADGAEPSFDADTDVDGLINALDADSDNDGLRDGTELGLPCSAPGTRVSACIADADAGDTVTHPLVSDTDGGGMIDGSEDTNLNGVQDEGEVDPAVGADDGAQPDADNDVLSDGLEAFLGSDPRDADSDDDGLSDGLEPNPGMDLDDDGWIGVLDPDSDNDGLFDGTETGHACDDPATSAALGVPASLVTCRADADPASVTSALRSDTDRGGTSDGQEDENQDGSVDVSESDPNEPGDDDLGARCTDDGACAAPQGGRICVEGSCIQACRESAVDTCPPGYVCELQGVPIGRCSGEGAAGSGDDAGSATELDAGALDDGLTGDAPTPERWPPEEVGASLGGGGCACRATAPASRERGSASTALLAATLLIASWRRRTARPRRSISAAAG